MLEETYYVPLGTRWVNVCQLASDRSHRAVPKTVLMALLLVGLMAAILLIPTNANAGTCDVQTCHGTDLWTYTPTFNGAVDHIYTSALQVGDACNQFATSEMWVGTNYVPDISTHTWFIEDGLIHGLSAISPGCQSYAWFINEIKSDPNVTNAFIYPGFGLNVEHVAKVQYLGTGSIEYGAYRDGTLLFRYSGTPCCTKMLEAGGEADTLSTTVHGEARALQKEVDSNYTYGWGGSFRLQGPFYDPTTWIDPGTHFAYDACCVF
jgi:hypothetical protein